MGIVFIKPFFTCLIGVRFYHPVYLFLFYKCWLMMVIFDLRLLIVKVWLYPYVILETFNCRNVLKDTRPSASETQVYLSSGHQPAPSLLTDVRPGMSGSLPGGSVISRLLINADPFNSEPENL